MMIEAWITIFMIYIHIGNQHFVCVAIKFKDNDMQEVSYKLQTM